MKVILLQDVAKIGRRFQIVEVPDGYARNQLIPKRMAEPATPAGIKHIEKMRADSKATVDAGNARFQSAMESLNEKKIKVPADVNEKGHTFKAVSEDEVVVAAKSIGVDIEASMIVFYTPIKSVGEHAVQLVIGSSKADFTIEVIKK